IREFVVADTRLEALLDFVMLRQLADQMGIQLTHSDIEAAFDRILGVKGWKTAVDVLGEIRTKPTQDQLYEALGDELRVHLAAVAVLGLPETTARLSPQDLFSLSMLPESQREERRAMLEARAREDRRWQQLLVRQEYPLPPPGPFAPA